MIGAIGNVPIRRDDATSPTGEQLRQLGDVDRDAPRLVAGEQMRR
jgi:hypothetical protein